MLPAEQNDVDDYPGQAPCAHCFESSGYMARCHPATWSDPAWADSDPTRPCPECNATGTVGCELVTLEDLENLADEELAMKKPNENDKIVGHDVKPGEPRRPVTQSRYDLLMAEAAADNFDGLGKPMVDFYR